MYKVSYKNNTPKDISQIYTIRTKQYLFKISYNVIQLSEEIPLSLATIELLWNL